MVLRHVIVEQPGNCRRPLICRCQVAVERRHKGCNDMIFDGMEGVTGKRTELVVVTVCIILADVNVWWSPFLSGGRRLDVICS